MAAGRGLNKGRGLGSLIPPKVQPEAAETPSEAKTPAKSGRSAEGGSSKKKKSKTPTYTDFILENEEAAPTETEAGGAKIHEGTTETHFGNMGPADKKTADAVLREATPADTAPANAAPADAVLADTEIAGEVISVRLTSIVPNREQPRKQFDEEGLQELADSIREHGIVTPLLVQKKGKYYELIAGERRWRAAKLAGLKTAPVIVREFSEQQAAEIALIENIQRENLNAMEEAKAFKRLQDEFSLKQDEIAKRVSRSRSAVTNSLRLLKLEEHVQDMVAEGKLSMGHARALLALEDPGTQKDTAERVAKSDLSVRDTEKLVKKLLNPVQKAEPKAADTQIEAVYRDLEEKLRKSVGTKVSILPIKGKKGRVEIEYYSEEDLERIIDLLQQS